MGVDPVEDEADHARPLLGLPDQSQSGDRGQPGKRVLDQICLVGMDRVDPDPLHEVDRSAEADPATKPARGGWDPRGSRSDIDNTRPGPRRIPQRN